MPLTVARVKGAEPASRPYKLADEKGLYLYVAPTGAKSWRLKYRYDGKEQLLTFGLYPEVTLAQARDRRDDARSVLQTGRNPGVEAKRRKLVARSERPSTFAEAAVAWQTDQRVRWSSGQTALVARCLERDVLPVMGEVPLVDITAPVVLHVLRKIEERGAIETAKRIRGYLSAIFARAIAEGVINADPAAHVGRALKPAPRGAKQPALTGLPDLLTFQRVVDQSSASPATKLASRLLALTAVRVGVLRTAVWTEIHGIDWNEPDAPAPAAIWRIPAERMKLDIDDKGNGTFDHDVPLTVEAVAVLRALYLLTGRGRLLFPGQRTARDPMSDAAISTLYKRMDGGRYKGRMVPHGWRSAFSTLMNEWAMEHGKEGDRLLIDLMLAHRPKGMSGSEFAYNRARYTARRRALAETWAAIIVEGLESPMALLRGRSACNV